MSEYLFSYGTLQPEMAPGEIASAVKTLRRVGDGFVQGTLYDLGDYPGAVLDQHSNRKIEGTVFRISDSVAVLPQLDAYEEFDPMLPERSLFVRVKWPVQLEDGRTIDCWVYRYNGETDSLKIFQTGKFSKKRLAS